VDVIEQAALAIRQAYSDRQPCDPVREILPAGDVGAAYAVQEVNTKYWVESGRRVVGAKVGLTSKVVQAQLGVTQPDFGVLFADMAIVEGEEILVSKVLQPKIEAEIAFVLADDLDDEQLTIADVIGAIDYALPAIEIVDSRIRDWDINITDTIADNASSGLFVLGSSARKLSELNLRMCGMVIENEGKPVSVGAGLASLGNPINAALWLAETMAQAGRPLRRGSIILSGALGPMFTPVPGDVLVARVSGLGSVTVAFAADASKYE